jgi:SAM-dependent methyltransferase
MDEKTRKTQIAGKWMSCLRRFVAANRALCQSFERRYSEFFGFPSYQDELRKRIVASLEGCSGDVLEIGGIDRPFLSKDDEYRYVGMDIEEKPRCHDVYDRFLVQSVEDPIGGDYDLVMSITLLEHVRDNASSIANIFDALRPACETHHYIPGKGHPYALALRAVGPKWQTRLIGVLRPDSVEETGYPTYFDHCTARDMARVFEKAGFEDVQVRTFYRANDYFAFFFPAFVAVTAFENICKAFDWSYFASGFVISGHKPAGY